MELTPAFVLHQRPYRESSLLVDVLTQQYGRRRLIARGIRHNKRQQAHPFQLFQPLWLNWFGAGELATLQKVERDAPAYRLTGQATLCGLYVNELLFYLLQTHDPEPEIYQLYQQTLNALQTIYDTEKTLRLFEKHLLEQLGYGLRLDEDADGRQILPEIDYRYSVDEGLRVVTGETRQPVIQGKAVLQLQAESDWDAECLKQIKQIMRTVLNYYLEGRPLRSRQLFAEMQHYAKISNP